MVGLQRVFRKICVILAVGLIVYSIGNVSKKFTSEPDSTDHVDTGRKLLESPTWEGCSYELGHGHYVFLIPYVVCILLSFIGLALICDDFFVPSLEAISDKLDLSEDVAGATFMAAGSSAPELFTSVAGVGVGSDVGVGTIVGSAMFNILIIVALSAVLAGKSLFLDWRPLFRDATMYGISIIFFIGFAWDGYLEWYEALTLLILYIIYIVLMKFNSHLMKLLLKVECTFCKNTRLAPVQLNEESGASVNAHGSTVTAGDSTHSDHHKHRFVHSHKGELAGTISHRRRSTTSSLPLQHTQHHYQQELPILEDHSQEIKPIIPSIHISSESSPTIAEEVNQVQPSESDAKDNNGKQLPINAVHSSASQIGSIESEEDPTITLIPFLPPIKAAPPDWTEAKEGGLLGWIKYILSMTLFVVSFPFMVVFTWTIPNCSKNRKWYVVTASFLMSIFWIAALSFMMVTVVARLGCLLGVGEFTMGLVVVAIGTSIPDAISSILVARDGFGDMAVSNAIGSNVFDINLGLGLPFLLRTCIDKGKAFALLSEEQMAAYHAGEYTITPHAKFSLALLLVIFLVIGIFTAFRFKLNAFVGLSFVAMYILFLTYAFIQETVCEEGKHC